MDILVLGIVIIMSVFIFKMVADNMLPYSRRNSNMHTMVMIGIITAGVFIFYPLLSGNEGIFGSMSTTAPMTPGAVAVNTPINEIPRTVPTSYNYSVVEQNGTKNVFNTDIYTVEDINDLDILK